MNLKCYTELTHINHFLDLLFNVTEIEGYNALYFFEDYNVRFIKQHFFGLLALIVSGFLGYYVLTTGTEDVINLSNNQLDSTVYIKSVDAETGKGNIGTGVFINKDGNIITNAHVVGKSTYVDIQLRNKKVFRGRVIYLDTDTDLAVIVPEEKDLSFSHSVFDCARVPSFGEIVIVIGHPLGLSWTVTKGIISTNNRFLNDVDLKFYQVDALIYFGNSGGPAFDIYGKIIGIVQSVYSYPSSPTRQVPTGHGFLIPAQKVCEKLNTWNIKLN
jgi:S1-C subfamily serine protease